MYSFFSFFFLEERFLVSCLYLLPTYLLILHYQRAEREGGREGETKHKHTQTHKHTNTQCERENERMRERKSFDLVLEGGGGGGGGERKEGVPFFCRYIVACPGLIYKCQNAGSWNNGMIQSSLKNIELHAKQLSRGAVESGGIFDLFGFFLSLALLLSPLLRETVLSFSGFPG